MNRDGRVTEHGLGAGGGNMQHFARASDWILDGPEVALSLLVINLVVGDGRAELSVPVDESLPAKDLAGLEQVEERATDGSRVGLAEREPRPVPVARASHEPKLIQDAVLVLVFPGPDPLHERLAAQVVAGLLLLFEEPLLDDRLRGDAGVVGAGH